MSIKCDILVVGAGPVGTTFSFIAAKKGYDVLIVDRKNEVASPLRGGEAVSKFLFEEIYQDLPFLKNVYKWPIKNTIIYNPVSKITSREDKWKSFMLNRKEVEKNIAQEAVNAGSRLMLGTTVYDVSFDKEKIKEVKAKTINGHRTIKPKIVVGADGATSIIRRKIIKDNNYSGIKDWGCAVEIEVTNLKLDYPETMQLFVGEIVGGYGYIFPKGNDRADVGVGARPFYGKNPLQAKSPLESFYDLVEDNLDMKRQLKNSSPLEIKGGIIDLSTPLYPVHGNAILVGDSANQNFAYVGEGIIPGWQAAIIAGEKVVEALQEDSLKLLKKYPEEYEASFIGMEARKTVKIKDNISKVIAMDIDSNIKTILTSMLELEIINWDGKELKTAFTYKDPKKLLDYAKKLVHEKQLKIDISPR